MSRRLSPSPPIPSRFPRLAAAWRLVLAPLALAPLAAHADATVPPPKQPEKTKKPPGTPHPTPVPTPKEPPTIDGEFGRVMPPSGEAISMLLHRHAPGEPCKKGRA